MHALRCPRRLQRLTFAVKHSNMEALEQRLLEVSTPGSSDYGRHLTNAQVCRRGIHSWLCTAPAPPPLRQAPSHPACALLYGASVWL